MFVYNYLLHNLAKRYNVYNLVFFIIFLLLILGNIGGAFQPVRLFSLSIFPLFVIKLRLNRSVLNKYFVLLFLFISLWWFTIFVSFFWTPDIVQAKKEIVYYIVNFSLVVNVITCYLFMKNSFQFFLIISSLVVIITFPFALYELITDTHFYLNEMGEIYYNLGNDGVIHKKYSSLWFGNFNTYMTFLAFSMPSMFSLLFLFKRRIDFFFQLSILIVIALIVVQNASRGALACLIINFVILIIYSSLLKRKGMFYCMSFILICVGLINADIIFSQLIMRISAGTSFASDSERGEIIKSVILVLHEYCYLGSGIGSMKSVLLSVSNGIPAAHNLFFEILLQYGVQVFVPFVCFYIFIFKRSIFEQNISKRYLLLTYFVSLPFMSVINSGYLLYPFIWVYFTVIFCVLFCKKKYDETII